MNDTSPTTPPVALTIAGSDNSAGAGAQADLKTFTAHRVYGLTAITCIVAEVPGRVSAIQPATSGIVAEQIRLVLDAFPVAAIKTGMLYSREIIETVARMLDDAFSRGGRRPHLVVDPVMVASSGDALLEPDAVAAYKERLFPLADLITPNLDEARELLGRPVLSLNAMEEAVRELARTCKTAILLKGGHLRGAVATDLLATPDGELHRFEAPFLPGIPTHGTGCTYAAAITANLALGHPMPEAVAAAKRFLHHAIAHHHRWQTPTSPDPTIALNHFAPREPAP